MTIVGMNSSLNSKGEKVTTIHVTEPFEPYYNDKGNGKTCSGVKVESIYVGTYDCDELDVGMDIEILYAKSITTKRGTFQPIKRIELF